jgi:sugar phosphate isomerase/epimerase
MAPFFVNLPLSYAARDPELVRLFIDRRIHPELGLDLESLAFDPSWHVDLAHRLTEADIVPAVHLPFWDLAPGSPDPLIREATRSRLAQAFEMARVYAPAHIVGHCALPRDDAEHDWIERAAAMWRELLDGWEGHPPLHLENTYETAPGHIARLIDAIGRPGVGVCFDVGHWFTFGLGKHEQSLQRWVNGLDGRISHLHLHDNAGRRDEHLAMGKGGIPFGLLFELLAAHGSTPSATLEPHTVEDFQGSVEFIRANPELFARFETID